MLIKATLCTLLIILVAVIAISYYMNKEGFEDITSGATPGVVLAGCSDGTSFNIKAKTKDGSTITGAKLVYSSTSNTVDTGAQSDSVLAGNLTIPPTLDVITSVPLTSLSDGKTYYLIGPNDSAYVGGSTTALNGIMYAKDYVNKCVTPSAPASAPAGGANSILPGVPTPTLKPILPGVPTPTLKPILPGVPTPGDEAPGAVPQNNQVMPEISISGSGYDAMTLQQRMELLKDIQKVVRNELVTHRATDPIISGETRKCNPTDATAQGKEYSKSCYKGGDESCPSYPDGTCPPLPDMSQYIKKDAIPCWGCALDY
jgi:hypothetical protein